MKLVQFEMDTKPRVASSTWVSRLKLVQFEMDTKLKNSEMPKNNSLKLVQIEMACNLVPTVYALRESLIFV